MHVGFACAFGLLGLICSISSISLYLSSTCNAWILVLLWPAFVCLSIASSYSSCGNGGQLGVKLIGKSKKTGEIPFLRIVILFPYFMLAWGWWYFRQTILLRGKENPYDLVSKDIYVGRYPLWYPKEFPQTVKHVIDVTGEFPGIQEIQFNRTYLCCRGMDMQLPSKEDLATIAIEASKLEGEIYIHCANGHGRSASLAALIMVLRGNVTNVEEAFTVMQKARPKVYIHSEQMKVLKSVEINSIVINK